MVTVFDVPANEFINYLKEELKKVDAIKEPDWAKFAKTYPTANRPPEQDDFWYIRAAAILRQLYIRGRPLGVQRLRVKYGKKKKTGHKPDYFTKASGKIIRNILQQLEAAGFVKKVTINGKKGRVLTKEGMSFLDKKAAEVMKNANKPEQQSEQ